MSRHSFPFLMLALVAALAAACGGDGAEGGEGRPGASRGGGGRGGGMPFGAMGDPPGGAAAVPVETAGVERRDISSYIETHGTLEAENEVDVLARVSAPIVELRAEEGMTVRKGQLLARLDEDELRSQVDISRANLVEAEQAWERAQNLNRSQLISAEEYEQAQTRFQTARAQLEGNEIQLGYTEVRAPFDGLIVTRYVDFAQQVSPNTPLFRLSDFDPLLCPIQVPERDLGRLEVGQKAYLQVEAWPDERFDAQVLRIRPVVDAATGTVRVTLEVSGRGRLRPGMFADVFVETDRRSGTLVMPKKALTLDSIGDTVYVADEGVARRREVELGFAEGDFVEVVSGLAEGEAVVVVGQDGLSDGTPIQLLDAGGGGPPPQMAGGGGQRGGGFGPGGFDPSQMTPEQKERARQVMRSRGMSEEQIEARLGGGEARPAGAGEAQGAPGGAPAQTAPGGGGPPGGFDPARMTPEMVEQMKEKMRARGMSEEQIEERLRRIRERQGSEGSGDPEDVTPD